MIRKFINKLKFMIFTFSLIATLGSWCDDGEIPTETPPQNTCGTGSGSYYFSEETSLPESFDCNSAGSFLIELKPGIDPSYIRI